MPFNSRVELRAQPLMASRVGRDIVTQPPLPLPERGERSRNVADRNVRPAVNPRSRLRFPATVSRFGAAAVVRGQSPPTGSATPSSS